MSENKSVNNDASTDAARFESDSQKIVRKHLEDKDHVITDDDIRGVRVGLMPPAEETFTSAEVAADAKVEEEVQNIPANEPVTSWDTVDR